MLEFDPSKLIKGNRYLFHYKYNSRREYMTFRATFVDVFTYNIYKTLIIKEYVSELYEPLGEIWYINFDLMEKAENLVDIMKDGNSILMDDVLLEIDKYI